MNLRERIILATPIVCLMIYLGVGYGTDVWSPTWMIFFMIPIMPILLYDVWYRDLITICIIVGYIASASYTGLWHPLWIMLLGIPVVYIIIGPKQRPHTTGFSYFKKTS